DFLFSSTENFNNMVKWKKVWRRLQMNLDNFEEMIDPVILQRGIDYYLEGRVSKILAISENYYHLTIEGTLSYNVTVKLSTNGRIASSNCTCPYEGGPICKHQVA